MCDECIRLQHNFSDITERLRTAQSRLASYSAHNQEDGFAHLWQEARDALRTMDRIREEMASHASLHLAPLQREAVAAF